MSKRKKTSGGQALVLVTMSLIAMAGIMGLAVDLGWSFFVEKQAQAAADGAALAAVQEAMQRLRATGSVTGFTCASSGQTSTTVDCETGASGQLCSNVATASNLNNGCQYAKKNGFDWTVSGSSQNVWMQSNDGQPADLPTTAPGVKNISYWVTVRTVQTVPQLFSAVLGNKTGLVAASATAAIAGSIKPGSFFGMNRAGDCLTGPDAGNCGLDVITGHGKGNGKSGSQSCGPNGITSDLCAPAGIILASSCSSVQGGVCDQADAGIEQGAAAVGASLTVMGPAGGVTGNWEDLNGNSLLPPAYSTNPKLFQDPTAGTSQPPLVTSAANMGTCGLPHSSSTAAVSISGTLGPYLYYTYSITGTGGKPAPDGGQISISGTATFSSSSSVGCPTVNSLLANGSAGTTVATTGTTNTSFPTYIFLGGLNNGGTMNLGPGQFVMAGTNSTTGNVFINGGTVNGTSSLAQATGSMFIFTDAAYPGMNLTSSTAANFTPLVSSAGALSQGSINVDNNVSLEMYGLVPSMVTGSTLPSSMDPWSGVVWWQDRRNSNVGYNEASGSPGCNGSCTGDDGSVISCAIGCANGNSSTPNILASSNHVTPNSPGVVLGNGNTKIALHGVYYQPRGAYIDFGDGNTGINCGANGQCPLQVVTGAVLMGNGNTRMVLAGPTNPLLTYKATLIQ